MGIDFSAHERVKDGIDLVDEMSDEELNALVDYIRVSYKTRQATKNAKARATLAVGSRVKIVGRTKPQYLSGLTGVVIDFKSTKICMKLDDGPVGKFRSGTITCPPSMLEVI